MTKKNNISPIGQITITFELFVDSIEAIRKQYDQDTEFGVAIEKAFPESSINPYKNHFLQNALVKILQEAFNDATAKSWIEYFMWELDFGRKYKDKTVQVQGQDYSLSSVKDLWNILNLTLA
jgi:hypothetical protein